jgi:signal transduction histidine kinase
MRVGQRLFLAVIPAIVALLTVAALVYWGEYAREAPEWVVALALVAAVGSALLAWRNTRYVAMRIEQLAARRDGRSEQSGSMRRAAELVGMVLHPQALRDQEVDELDRIELLLDRLTQALTHARAAQDAQLELLAERQREYGRLVEQSVEEALRRLEEVRLPLHILLENHFGDLNENQEEMLGAARAASESVDGSLLRLREVVRLDLGALTLRRERVHVQDVIAGVLPSLMIAAGDRGMRIESDLSPTLPVLQADRGRLQEAFAALLGAVVQASESGASLSISGEHDALGFRLTVRGGREPTPSGDVTLATRLVRAHGGSVAWRDGELVIALPT